MKYCLKEETFYFRIGIQNNTKVESFEVTIEFGHNPLYLPSSLLTILKYASISVSLVADRMNSVEILLLEIVNK